MGIKRANAKTGQEGETLAKIRGQYLAAVRPTFFILPAKSGILTGLKFVHEGLDDTPCLG